MCIEDTIVENNNINDKQAQEYIEDVIYGINKETKAIINTISKNLKDEIFY